MSAEKSPEQTPAPPSQEPFDREWYAEFQRLGAFQAYEYLDDTSKNRGALRAEFEANKVVNPALAYHKLDSKEWRQREEELVGLKEKVLSTDTSNEADPAKMEVIKQVYRWRLNEKIAEARMLQAAARKDNRRFHRYSRFIYGAPSLDVFAYTVHSLRAKISEHLGSENHDLQQAARELQAVLPANLPQPQISALPSEETINLSRGQTLADLGHLVNISQTEGEADAPVIKQAFESALQEIRSEGWQVVINPDKASISVNQEQHAVNIPPSRRLSPANLKGLILHEIGTHVARREEGERSRLLLLGLGLDRYEGGEEGVATVRQQAFEEKLEDFAGLEGHLAISLAEGLDGTPRDFRQVYEILRRYHAMAELAQGKDSASAQKTAAKKAWDRCIRTFRGTDCQTPGAAFTKDIIYREGNIGVWELIRSNPAEMKRFNVGKYDPTNSRHIWILTELGITEKDLQRLEQ
jgi:hypothetical protein